MHLVALKEMDSDERRISLTPDNVKKFVKLGLKVTVESGIAEHLNWTDDIYKDAGAEVSSKREELLAQGDIILRVRSCPQEEVTLIKPSAIHISFFDVFNERETVEKLAEAGVNCISMEMVPRSTLAQKMDALSSQHSLAGYYMVMTAAERLGKILPMMMTPCGTLQPARVFIVGAGVAGLQAIATAKRLGARVEAFDTREVVAEQVESLGAKFIKIDLGETGQTDQGYAKALTEEQQDIQRQGMLKACAQADIVITTAQLFGRPAPRVVTKDMLKAMKDGSLVVDYAVESGGNVEGSVPGEEVLVEGVRVLGLRNYAGHVAADASRMYSNNLYNMVEQFWDKEQQKMLLTEDDEIIQSSLITRDKIIINETLRRVYGLEEGV